MAAPGRDTVLGALAGAAALVALATPARADLKLCNRLSYVVATALGVEDAGTTVTRGWYRIDPGQCRAVLAGAMPAQHLYVHARALSVYGPPPLPQSGHADLCVAPDDFTIATARACRAGQSTTRFTEIKPTETADGLVAVLAEDADYSDEQARLAGIQRLLVMSGYDASPIDGVTDPKTEAALARFLADHGLGAEAAKAANFFDVLIDAAQKPAGTGFSWCNDTAYPVMAALGTEDKTIILTRVWYRVDPGKCLRPGKSESRSAKLYRLRRGGPMATAVRSGATTSRSPGAAIRCCAPVTSSSSLRTTRTAWPAASTPASSPKIDLSGASHHHRAVQRVINEAGTVTSRTVTSLAVISRNMTMGSTA